VRILVTRPQPGSMKTAVALKERGHEPITAPLFQMEILSKVDPDAGPWTAILLTSGNAIWGIANLAWRDGWRAMPVFAVGERTAKAARDEGFTEVTYASGNVNDLVDLIAARLKPPARLLYLAGQERSGDLAGALRARHFSLHSAEAFVRAAGNAGLLAAALAKPVHYCLSDQVAEPLRRAGAAKLRIAARPDEDALLALCD